MRAINRPGLYGDGNTLYLRVAPGGSKQWVQRLVIDGLRHDIGLGDCGWVTLAEAKQAAWENRRLARNGGDPRAAKRPNGVPRSRLAHVRGAEAPLAKREAAQNWWAHLERHAFPAIGDVPIDRIDRGHVLRVLSPIWTENPESARRVRRNIRATLQWAVAHGFIERNPAGEAIDGALPPHPSVNSHPRAPAGLLIEELRIVLQERWLQADRAKRRLRRSWTRWKKLRNPLTLEVPIVVMFVCGLLWPKAVLWRWKAK